MPKGTHDPLVYRLCQILIKLNQGEKLYRDSLASEFGVTTRTIQRDMNVRFAYLPIERSGACYWLDPAYLGKLTAKEVRRFAELSGVAGLFPSLSTDFLRDIFDSRIQSALLVKGHHYEDISGLGKEFRVLEESIIARRCVSFDYRRDTTKSYASVQPYRLINNKGIWYLAGVHDDKIKTFAFTRIEGISILEQPYAVDDAINKKIESEDGIWINNNQYKVEIKVSREAADYFRRRTLIAGQIIEKELECGGVLVSATISHASQIIPIIRYWIPHLRVISPVSMQKEIETTIQDYLAVVT